ncbi:catsup protein [Capsaspora owczarzaki ATCC 30864]|uniref:Catsup protein n=1 Tax=Capsaspora owczarzaki (strain ATCC 30864) TaxID=595528 RepID=A0A0D2WPY0_CAPO3|nr:catsup protein [Capsaspora owczarzaki ATCC 30864]KJE93565.1 catsup protein [Capsaspora owczarzaki ATCC 30864]|eukprot:XP_004348160.2 catsup protein [Capsaspora owczarzaki ATCC 30864]
MRSRRLVVVLCSVALIQLLVAAGSLAQENAHAHAHAAVNGAGKYGKAVNVAAAARQQHSQGHNHAHSHDHGHSHSHSHGHSHEHAHAGEPRIVAVAAVPIQAADQAPSQAHNHNHNHDHDHDHNHDHDHDHDHGHGHSHEHAHAGQAAAAAAVSKNAITPSAQSSPVPDQAHNHDHHDDCSHDHSHDDASATSVAFGSPAWIHALGSTALISILPIALLFFIPLDKAASATHASPLLKVLLSFAAGGLLGDVFLHLLPHSFAPHSEGGDDNGGHSHSHSHSHAHSHSSADPHTAGLLIGLWIVSGIFAFFVIEKIMRLLGRQSHSHSHAEPAASDSAKKAASSKDGANKDGHGHAHEHHDHQHEEEELARAAGMKAAGWLNLVADFAHNFTDGMAIGAMYLHGGRVGLTTTIAVLMHEIPHELGDYAILIRCGMSKKQAILAQFSTAIGAVCGTFLGLMSEGIAESSSWIAPFAAGGFIYIALVTVVPELLDDSHVRSRSTTWAILFFLIEALAFVAGVGLMGLIALFE